MRRSAKKSSSIWLLSFAFFTACAVALSLAVPSPFSDSAVHASPSRAAFEGLVIHVADGDSITVRAGEDNIRIRLAEIDAPERGQPWGTRAKQELTDMVAGKNVTIQPRGEDRYGRTIAVVEDNGRNINRDMVTRGAAWAYRDYLTDQSYVVAESQAKANRAGLWSMDDGQITPPWQYRKDRREAKVGAVSR